MNIDQIVKLVPKGYKLAIVIDHIVPAERDYWVEFRLLRGVKQATWKCTLSMFTEIDQSLAETYVQGYMEKAITEIDAWYESRKDAQIYPDDQET